jgi:hypothetical protein
VVLRLHRSLLLRETAGRFVVGVAVLIAVVMLLTAACSASMPSPRPRASSPGR